MKWAILIALGIATLGFIPLMGIPGAIVLTIGETFANLLRIELRCTSGDRAWPAAILATWIWPISIPLSFFICFRKLKNASMRLRQILFSLLLLISSLLVTAGTEWMARSGI